MNKPGRIEERTVVVAKAAIVNVVVVSLHANCFNSGV
jgi:hypothetical protein